MKVKGHQKSQQEFHSSVAKECISFTVGKSRFICNIYASVLSFLYGKLNGYYFNTHIFKQNLVIKI